MSVRSRFLWPTKVAWLSRSLVCACSSPIHHVTFTSPFVTLTQLSSDPYTNKTSQHHTEVEPDTFAFGNTVVAVFKAGRFFKGGASNIGWATSINEVQPLTVVDNSSPFLLLAWLPFSI